MGHKLFFMKSKDYITRSPHSHFRYATNRLKAGCKIFYKQLSSSIFICWSWCENNALLILTPFRSILKRFESSSAVQRVLLDVRDIPKIKNDVLVFEKSTRLAQLRHFKSYSCSVLFEGQTICGNNETYAKLCERL